MKTVADLVRKVGRRLGLFRSNTEGNIALSFAFFGPAVILLGVGAIDLFAVHTAQVRLQSIADASALASAPTLALATDGTAAKARAASFVSGQMSEWEGHPDFTGTYEIVEQGGQRAIRVLLRGHRPSFFANMLPPGGWHFVGDATATSVGLVPLCVLAIEISGKDVLDVRDTARIAAPSCMVHSNRDIKVKSGSIRAAAVQAVTSATGSISPSPGTGATPIEDPFARIPIEDKAECTGVRIEARTSGTLRLPAGVHCDGVIMRGTSQLVLEPGEHLFRRGALILEDSARLSGTDVVLVFDTASKFAFRDQSMVNLEGRTSGPFSGIVLAATRDNRQDFVIASDHVETLLGVLYIPSARLVVEGSADVARDSAWTVIVARKVRLDGNPSLFINANYNATTVPVPQGVGPRAGGSRLID